MKSSTLAYLLGFILIIGGFHPSAGNVLEQTCSSLGEFYVTKDFCMKILGGDPRSKTADRPGITTIAVELGINNATVVKTKLEELTKSTSDGVAKKAQEGCLILYSQALSGLNWSLDAIKSGFYAAAAAVDAPTLSVPAGCSQIGGAGPISKENNDFSNLAILIHAITSTC